MAKEKILISACLAGINCVYDGTNKFHSLFASMHKDGKGLVICPEVLGGLNIPHNPSEIEGGDGFDCLKGKARVMSLDGKDVTSFFLKGAQRVLALAKKKHIKKAILKSKSPSCGCGVIFDGSFSKKLVPGYGVTAALLMKNGIEVISDVKYIENEKFPPKADPPRMEKMKNEKLRSKTKQNQEIRRNQK